MLRVPALSSLVSLQGHTLPCWGLAYANRLASGLAVTTSVATGFCHASRGVTETIPRPNSTECRFVLIACTSRVGKQVFVVVNLLGLYHQRSGRQAVGWCDISPFSAEVPYWRPPEPRSVWRDETPVQIDAKPVSGLRGFLLLS